MLQKTEAIVLKAIKYGDQKLIVDFYTEELGYLSCAVRLSTTQRGKMKKFLFQPLTLLLLEVDVRQSRQLQTLGDVQFSHPLPGITGDCFKMSQAMFLSEMLWYATRQEQADRQLFTFIRESIKWFDSTALPVANFHLCFLLRLTEYLGFHPLIEDWQPHHYFDMMQGTFSLQVPFHNEFLRPEESAYMPLLLRMRYRNMHLYRFSREQRQHCLNLIIKYYRMHLPSLPELKTLDVLHELYD